MENSHNTSSARTLSYFVSDVHLGLQVEDPAGRERRFVDFLNSIPKDRTEALYLLGDIWDFWYEWKYTVPKGYIRVFAALMDLMEAGVTVYFFYGNHDMWAFRYFEELGMVKLTQPWFTEIGGKVFCLGHGDGLGRTALSYKIMSGAFHSPFVQFCFGSFLHPTVAMGFGRAWSRNNRLAKRKPYVWSGIREPLAQYAEGVLKDRKVDFFIFGHWHVPVRQPLSEGAELYVLDSWIFRDNCIIYDSASGSIRVVE